MTTWPPVFSATASGILCNSHEGSQHRNYVMCEAKEYMPERNRSYFWNHARCSCERAIQPLVKRCCQAWTANAKGTIRRCLVISRVKHQNRSDFPLQFEPSVLERGSHSVIVNNDDLGLVSAPRLRLALKKKTWLNKRFKNSGFGVSQIAQHNRSGLSILMQLTFVD